MPAQKKTSLGLNQWIGSEYPKRVDFVEDNKIINDELENRVKYTDFAEENKAGIITYAKIKEIAPKPDLSPYQLKTNFWKYSDSSLKVVGTNTSNGHSYIGLEIEMFNNAGDYTGSFHTNKGRAYYKVPNRAGGGWCEIMDNHDMAARDSNIQHAHNRITDTWNRANDAWNKAHDAQVNRIYEIRLAGYIWLQVGISGASERNGYVITGVYNDEGSDFSQGDHVQMRVLQFHRNGQWMNAYFA